MPKGTTNSKVSDLCQPLEKTHLMPKRKVRFFVKFLIFEFFLQFLNFLDVPEEDDDGVLDLLDMEIPEEQEEAIKKTLEEKTKYKEVAPTWELVRITKCGKPRILLKKIFREINIHL